MEATMQRRRRSDAEASPKCDGQDGRVGAWVRKSMTDYGLRSRP